MYNKEPHVTSVREIQCMDMCDINTCLPTVP